MKRMILFLYILSASMVTVVSFAQKKSKAFEDWTFKNQNEAVPGIADREYKTTIESIVVIINDKIYKFDDERVKNLKKEELDSMTVIDDPNTEANVKRVLIVKTK